MQLNHSLLATIHCTIHFHRRGMELATALRTFLEARPIPIPIPILSFDPKPHAHDVGERNWRRKVVAVGASGAELVEGHGDEFAAVANTGVDR